MCHGGGYPAISGTALVGLCVVFSPILVPVAVVGGAAYGASVAASEVKKVAKRTSNVLMKERNRAVKKVGAAAFNAYLQDIHNRALKEPSAQTLIELAMALFLNNDVIGAEDVVQDAIKHGAKALESDQSDAAKEALGTAHYVHGVVLQTLPNFSAACDAFQKAIDFWKDLPNMHARVRPDGAADTSGKIRLTLGDAYNSLGFATQRTATEETLRYRDQDSFNTAYRQLCRAIELHSQAIEVTAEQEGMYLHNRAMAYYHRAVLPVLRFAPDTASYDPSAYDYSKVNSADLRSAMQDWDAAIASGRFGTTAEAHSMKAQAHTLLDNPQAAQEEHDTAQRLDPKVWLLEPAGVKSAQHLCNWPIPKMLFDRHRDAHTFEKTFLLRPEWCDHCMKFIGPLDNLGNVRQCTKCTFRCHAECFPKADGKICWKTVNPGIEYGDTVEHRALKKKGKVEDVNRHECTVTVKWDDEEEREELKEYHLHVIEEHEHGRGATSAHALHAAHTHHVKPKLLHRPTWCSACGKFIQGLKAVQCFECTDTFHEGCEPQGTVHIEADTDRLL